jgi:hypothetical protein
VLQMGRPRPYLQIIRLGRLVKDKHSSLLQRSINYGYKKFYRIAPEGKNLTKYSAE